MADDPHDMNAATPPSSPPPEQASSPPPPPPPLRPVANQRPPAAPTPPPWAAYAPPPKRGVLRRFFRVIFLAIFGVSIVLNLYLLVLIAAWTGGALDRQVVRDGLDDEVVAIYTVDGTIDGATVAAFRQFYFTVRDDRNIKAVVLRVESPGGGAAASDEIHAMMRKIRHDLNRVVVVSMGNVAASGGYYIAAPAQEIYAQPTTMTGSIGVLWPVGNLKGLFEKLGIETVVIRSKQSQRWKADINLFEKADVEALRENQKMLDEVHERFMQVVRDGRAERLKERSTRVTVKDFNGKDVVREQIEPLDGHVYLAAKAKQWGLIDRIGYLDDATDGAAKLAMLSDPTVIRFVRRRTLRERMGFSDLPAGLDVKEIKKAAIGQGIMMVCREW